MSNSFMQKILVFLLWLGASLLIAFPASAQKAFVRDDLAQEATRIEQRLRSVATAPSSQPVPTLLREAQAALTRSDARRALQFANAAVLADAASPEAWRLMAQAALAVDPRDFRERYDMAERAMAAAYASYARARTKADEATSLALLADIFTR
ncbi:MAG: hypothetical protein ACKVON_09340, partial [Beijerinckiaceae bacterium]